MRYRNKTIRPPQDASYCYEETLNLGIIDFSVTTDLGNRYFRLGLSSNDIPFVSFLSSCDNTLHKEATRKKYVRGNHSLFMNKKLPKAIMLRNYNNNHFLKKNCVRRKQRQL